MNTFDRKKHWENIYQAKEHDQVSWFQEIPSVSLGFLKQNNISKNSSIIDVGGGDSLLADHLLEMGYRNITVLDISQTAIDKARKRLGDKADRVKWIVADAATFEPEEKYDFWHDRATFHFLTDEAEINNYIRTAEKHLNKNGILVVGTFSEQGPEKCSNIYVRRYSETTMAERLSKWFEKIRCITIDHLTPFNTLQNFVFCSFRRI